MMQMPPGPPPQNMPPDFNPMHQGPPPPGGPGWNTHNSPVNATNFFPNISPAENIITQVYSF